MFKSKRALSILAFLLFVSFLVGTASAGTPYYINGTTYPMIWNGTYASENINYMTYWTTGYDIFWNGGLLQTVWDGTYAYDMIAYPDNGTAISPWTFWHVESYNPTNKKWGETIPISNQFIKIDNSTLKRVMTMGSGEQFNITYHNYGTRIKQDLEFSNVLAREYRLTYRIDSVAAQDVNVDTKKFTPGFFNNFTIYDVADVQPYTVNRTFNETSLLWEGNGSYLYGWNVSATIDNTNRKMYFTLTNGQVMAAGQTVYIDPSWSTNGSTTPAWQNSTYNNFMLDRNTGNIILPDNATDGLVLYHKMSGSSGITSFDMNTTSNNNGTWYGNTTANWTGGKYGNALQFDGVDDYVQTSSNNYFIYNANKTVTFWMRSSDIQESGQRGIFNVGNIPLDSSALLLIIQNNAALSRKLSFYSGGYYTGTTVLSNNVWYFITYTYESVGYTNRLYINGNIDINITKQDSIGKNQNYLFFGSAYNNYFNGSIDEVRIYNRALTNDEINQTMINTMKRSDNLTAWHDSGSGNEVYQIDVNASGGTNANYSAFYRTNGTGAWTAIGTPNSTSNQSIALTTKYQNTDVKVELYGNSTVTPELTQITFWTQAVSAGNQPNITSWGNNYTNNNTLSFTVPQNTNITFNSTANQTLTTCSWVGATQINCSADTYGYKLFDTAGTQYVNLSGSNANGSTLNSVNWTISVTSGATTYEREAVQTIAVTNLLSRTYYANRESVQTIAVTDTVLRNYYANRNAEQGLSIADTTLRNYYANRELTQALSLVDLVDATYIDVGDVFERTVTQVIALADTVLRQPIYNRQPSQIITIVGTTERVYYANRELQQEITVSDTIVRTLYANRVISQAISVTDSVTSTYIYAGILYIRAVSQVISITDSVLRDFFAGMNYIISGYVHNILELPLENARIDYPGGYVFTDASGYYTASVPSGERTILGRAIGYMNNSNITTISGNTSVNFTLNERKTPMKAPGFGIGIVFISLILIYIGRQQKWI